MNAVEIEEAISLLAEQPFVPIEFPYSFLEAFGNKPTTIKRLQTGNNNKSDITGGVLQHNNIHIAVCETGTVSDTLVKLRESPATTRAKAKFILATDGVEFQAEDVNSGETIVCNYTDFHDYFGFFLPLAGISTVKQIRESAFDIKATGRLNKLYIELLRHNPDWAKPQRRHDMNHFLARLIFCFFAEDTGIFPADCLFTPTVQKMSAGDASDVHEVISEIFRAMDTKQEERAGKKIKNWANKFPYVNGELFSGSTETPIFSKIARSYLLHVGNLDWKRINPDIFGSMIQAVADEGERSALGMHYTSVPNILKVLNPLFLDDIRAQLDEAEDNSRKLLNLRKRLSRIRVFDPACGSGNFLVIAYKHMREIEHEINKRRGETERPTDIPLTNFRGIELRDFSAEIARLALIIAEYQCDVLYRGQKLALAEFLPLNAENWITCGNALRVEWLSVCPPTSKGVKFFGDDLFNTPVDQAEIDFENEGGETYICGNPPYLGRKYQSDEQKIELKNAFAGKTKDTLSLDYVSGWFIKAADFMLYTSGAAAAFVSTNSICQGIQVSAMWPAIFKQGLFISFAYPSFKWSNLASHNAGVTVSIIGLSKRDTPRRIFTENNSGETTVKVVEFINAYLVAAPNVFVHPKSKIPDDRTSMQFGNHPYYANDLMLKPDEARLLMKQDVKAKKFIRTLYGSKEFISGTPRYCIWIKDNDKEETKSISEIIERIKRVEIARKQVTKDIQAQKLVSTPYRFRDQYEANNELLVVPIVSSENRPYLPVGALNSRAIIHNKAFALYDAPLWNMALIASRMHWVWIGTVCVRMRTDFSYSNTLGWNTFPVPTLTAKNKEDLKVCAEEILLARERNFPATIAELYDPEKMPEDLRRAHDRNDEVLERIYIGRRFKNDTERLEKLFDLYTQMTIKGKTA
ncbi:class I SAM-dependent DNA methyltransferase [Spirosoma linguale]|uniref:site-specific DNA-methyltransferase (adenine-specific) n=1 Tax=Spirosoma linguale (strain ATCC 33905 / DSM 74 / LMG 10896 / Claus 1) TaxID=504472 RepID=D2QCK2_SPILD|nr:type II restriction enzyme, methylase subunit [Spirosoma linguale DSM 74]